MLVSWIVYRGTQTEPASINENNITKSCFIGLFFLGFLTFLGISNSDISFIHNLHIYRVILSNNIIKYKQLDTNLVKIL